MHDDIAFAPGTVCAGYASYYWLYVCIAQNGNSAFPLLLTASGILGLVRNSGLRSVWNPRLCQRQFSRARLLCGIAEFTSDFTQSLSLRFIKRVTILQEYWRQTRSCSGFPSRSPMSNRRMLHGRPETNEDARSRTCEKSTTTCEKTSTNFARIVVRYLRFNYCVRRNF